MSHDTDDAIRPLLPLAYRPGEFDDWGSVLAKDGRPFVESFPLDAEARQRGIQEGIDPSREIGEFVVKACNSYHALLEALQGMVEDVDGGFFGHDPYYAEIKEERMEQARAALAMVATTGETL